MAWLWGSLPIGRATAAAWAWRNRRELGRWAGFVWRAVPPSSAARDDVLTEARLRAVLAKDSRTRGTRSLAVRVADGTTFLQGRLSPDLHDLVASIAQETKGVRRVECRIIDKGPRRAPMSHAHAIPVPAIPPMPSS
jgi:osmotically-inducible protein OsmY